MVDRSSGRDRKLSKSLGLARLSIYGVGTIIGAGIYAVIAPAAAAAGEAVWLSFVVAAVISALSGLSYAELASALPSAGAEHSFLREALPKLPSIAFATGLFIAVHGAATFATVGLTFGNYFQSLVAGDPVLVALGLMAAATLINIAGLAKASLVNAVLTTAQISCLIVFAAAALFLGGDAQAAVAPMPQDWSGVLQGAAILFFIYSGYEHMATLSEEARNPDRDIWRAFMLALVVTTAVYLLVIFAVLSLVDAGSLAGSDLPLAAAAARLGDTFASVIVGAALLATANAVLSASLSGSRLLFGMARSGDLPGALTSTLAGSKSPWAAALVMLAIACAFAFVGEIRFVASLSSLGVTLVFAAVNVAVIVLRYRRPDLKRPFRVPSIGKLPVTAVAGVICSLALALQYELSVYLTFLAAFLAGAVPYAIAHRSSARRKA